MKSFTEFAKTINESFVNILPDEHEKRTKHIPELFSMVHKSYAKIGGIKGEGFASHEDMHKNIPMIKFNRQGSKINAAAFYKDSGGRKRVAIATNGTPEGKTALGKIMKNDLTQNRSYGETSGQSLAFLHKHMHPEDIKEFAIHPDVVKKAKPNEEYRDVPKDDEHLTKYPHLKDHFYQRKIGGEYMTKIALGSMGNEIK